MRVRTGLERVLSGADGSLVGKRVGLIANPTSVDAELRHAVDLLHADADTNVCALFGPEHGLRGDAQDMISVAAQIDERTGLAVHSLYGGEESSLEPAPGALDGLDALVFDIQDVGSRYYTYVWTMVYAMRACARAGIELVVLDRPNPIGGALVEGGEVSEGYRSFVGLCSIPNRHGLTAGEIAMWARDTEALDVGVSVVTMQGWSRDMYYADTQLPWVAPSPNMPTCDTALVYPGMCLIEGTEVSEARGTTRPFELVGAPFIDGHALAEMLDSEQLPGVVFRPMVFTPMFHKHAAKACGGVQLHVTDRVAFRPYRTGVACLRALRALWPDAFRWREAAYEFRSDVPAIDLLTGSPLVREAIDNGDSLDAIAATWAAAEDAFAAERRRWFLYE